MQKIDGSQLISEITLERFAKGCRRFFNKLLRLACISLEK